MRGATSGTYLKYKLRTGISIHAPHAGCDPWSGRLYQARWHFNPRTPCGVRPVAPAVDNVLNLISIHAPHAGCDSSSCWILSIEALFQSTHPMRGATVIIQSYGKKRIISIHAPHAGCDLLTARRPYPEIDFNPRTPCGVRQQNFTTNIIPN